MYYKAHYNALLEYVAGNLFFKYHRFDCRLSWEVWSQKITTETAHSFGSEKNPAYTYSTQTIG